MMSSPAKNNKTANCVASSRKQNYQNFIPKKTFVKQLPFWDRYRRGCIFGGAFLTFCFIYSAPIYYFFRTPPEYIDPRTTMWPGEIAKGKTYAEQLREKRLRIEAETEARNASTPTTS